MLDTQGGNNEYNEQEEYDMDRNSGDLSNETISSSMPAGEENQSNEEEQSSPKIRVANKAREGEAPIERPIGPRVGGLAQPRKLNDTTFSGYQDIVVKSPLIKLTTEDLNNVLDGGVDYYADDGNLVASKPVGVDGFGMKVISLGQVSRAQELTCKTSGKLFRRIWNGNTFTSWSVSYTTENKPLPTDIEGSIKEASYVTTIDDAYITKAVITTLPKLEKFEEVTPAD